MWSTFEKTGNINAYLSYKEIEKLNINTTISINDSNQSTEKHKATIS
jgi:hypothetical protein